MKDIETVILELTPYEAAILRHAMFEVLISWQHEKSKTTIVNIDEALRNAGINFLFPDEVEKGKIIHD